MYLEFHLDDLETDEPQGFADIVLNMKRDDTWHGIFFEASSSDLQFFGEAAQYLMEKKRTEGLKADVTFRALASCGIYEEPEEILVGKLDFRKYTETCGNTCSVTIPVEQTGCLMTLRNRYDQKVDMDSEVAFDKLTAIAQYDRMGFEMELPARELGLATRGYVADEGDTFHLLAGDSGVDHTIVRPTYLNKLDESLQTSNLEPIFNYASTINSQSGIDMTPQLLLEEVVDCFDGDFTYEFRLKGDFTNFKPNGNNFDTISVILKVVTWDGVGSIFTDATIVEQFDTGLSSGGFVNSFSGSFDHTFTGMLALADGIGLYAYIDFETDQNVIGAPIDWTVNFDPETYVNISAVKSCPSTIAEVYMVNEALSHATEAITDNCLKVKSDYFGRTDSQPYTSSEDGCGSLRILTSGLQIRRAEVPKFFASLKDLFDGLRGIDNIGMGIETNPFIPNAQWLRIEPVEYFYSDEEILSLPYAPEVKKSIQEQLHYSLIKVGYKKWEVENVNGLDEFNSNKEFRTGLDSVNNTLDITSSLIAGGYPWEITRQQSFATTGAADTKFDNETFIACVERDAYGFHIEQGNITDAANIFSPSTAYNWRIRPYYNLMRWFKSVANSYPNIIDTANKLFFSSGTGNLTATGEIAGAYPTCKLENSEKAENQDLHRTDFADTTEATPLWKPEYMTLRYLLSVKEYREIKANPYGYITVQCGTGEFIKGYIQNINYRLTKGQADFTLKLKWE
jgi:hypothetical protein